MMGKIADFDREQGNFLKRLIDVEKQLRNIERWAAPISERSLPNPPAIKAWRTTALSIPDITYTVVTNLNDQLSEDGLELESGNIVKLRRDSEIEWYAFGVMLIFAPNASNNRLLQLQVRNINTGAWVSQDWEIRPAAVNGLNTHISTTIIYPMGATDDAVRFRVYQDSGGALNLNLFLLNAVMIKSGDEIAG